MFLWHISFSSSSPCISTEQLNTDFIGNIGSFFFKFYQFLMIPKRCSGRFNIYCCRSSRFLSISFELGHNLMVTAGFTALTLLQLGTYGRQMYYNLFSLSVIDKHVYSIPLHTPLPQQAADVIYYVTIPVSLCLLGFALYCWSFAMFPYMYVSRKD
jgi:hypothetical protein